jgi:hypothetical protein
METVEYADDDAEHAAFDLRWQASLSWRHAHWDDGHVLAQCLERVFALRFCPRGAVVLVCWHPQLVPLHILCQQLVHHQMYVPDAQCRVTVWCTTIREQLDRYLEQPARRTADKPEYFVLQQAVCSPVDPEWAERVAVVTKGQSVPFRHELFGPRGGRRDARSDAPRPASTKTHASQASATQIARAQPTSISRHGALDRRVRRR